MYEIKFNCTCNATGLGTVNVQFWRFWTSRSTICWKCYPVEAFSGFGWTGTFITLCVIPEVEIGFPKSISHSLVEPTFVYASGELLLENMDPNIRTGTGTELCYLKKQKWVILLRRSHRLEFCQIPPQIWPHMLHMCPWFSFTLWYANSLLSKMA